jgi:predicted O-methyltransferase YrrM
MAKIRKFEEYLVSQMGAPVIPNFIRELCCHVDGMCEPETLTLLNYAVANCLEDHEDYLEIGTWNGRTAIGALLQNNRNASVIDPLKFDNSQVDFYNNIKKYTVQDRITMHQARWQDVRDEIQWPTFGIHFFDGNHGTNETLNAWEAFLPHCSDECILIADDLAMEPVEKDVDLFTRIYSDHIVFHYELQYGMRQSVLGFKK